MEQKLRILHLEDSRNDAELIRENLADEGIDCDIALVDTREGFVAAIERGGFDLILADYKLPLFDGLSALAIRQEQCPDVPFVFVSGQIGEERAIESLKSGATDYVIKDRLSRLVPAVNRALAEAKERTRRMQAEKDREKLVHELQEALARVKTLSGMLPICASCKKIRDDKGYWSQIESYISRHSDAEFTHGMCPDCEKKAYEELKIMKRNAT
ncbi:MAG: response regulator [Nitrospirota bacterium]